MKVKFILNSEYLEYLLNLSNQQYFAECYESIENLKMRVHLKLYKLLAENISFS